MLHELKALDAYRLTHDLSFRALETEMIAAGCPVDSRTLHVLLRSNRDITPRERTLYKVRRFLTIIADRRKEARRGSPA